MVTYTQASEYCSYNIYLYLLFRHSLWIAQHRTSDLWFGALFFLPFISMSVYAIHSISSLFTQHYKQLNSKSHNKDVESGEEMILHNKKAKQLYHVVVYVSRYDL